ncbi:MAG: hypothetical protein IPH84_10745 [Bacteroidales bacterium]|nr:hypothetical protein [Bacteroidales bacterium]
MYLFVECWKARPEWQALSIEARGAYMAELGKGIESLISAGVEIVSWSINDPDTSNRGPFDYFAAWKFPTRELAAGFEQIVQQSGWYNYFDQVNFKGEVLSPTKVIEQIIRL